MKEGIKEGREKEKMGKGWVEREERGEDEEWKETRKGRKGGKKKKEGGRRGKEGEKEEEEKRETKQGKRNFPEVIHSQANNGDCLLQQQPVCSFRDLVCISLIPIKLLQNLHVKG